MEIKAKKGAAWRRKWAQMTPDERIRFVIMRRENAESKEGREVAAALSWARQTKKKPSPAPAPKLTPKKISKLRAFLIKKRGIKT